MLSTYKLRPIPIASVATSTLHAFDGSLKIAAWASFVPVNIIHIKTQRTSTHTAHVQHYWTVIAVNAAAHLVCNIQWMLI